MVLVSELHSLKQIGRETDRASRETDRQIERLTGKRQTGRVTDRASRETDRLGERQTGPVGPTVHSMILHISMLQLT